MADIMAGNVFTPKALSTVKAADNDSLIDSLKQSKDRVSQAFNESIECLSEMTGVKSATISSAVEGLMEASYMSLESQIGFNPGDFISVASLAIDVAASKNPSDLFNGLWDFAADQIGLQEDAKVFLAEAVHCTCHYVKNQI